MTNMLIALMNRLMEVEPNTWYEVANTTTYPYAVVSIQPLADSEKDRQDNIVEIDVWDQTTDPMALEELTTKLDKALKKWKFTDDTQGFWLQRISRGNIPDEDINIRRRQIRYQIKRYEVE